MSRAILRRSVASLAKSSRFLGSVASRAIRSQSSASVSSFSSFSRRSCMPTGTTARNGGRKFKSEHKAQIPQRGPYNASPATAGIVGGQPQPANPGLTSGLPRVEEGPSGKCHVLVRCHPVASAEGGARKAQRPRMPRSRRGAPRHISTWSRGISRRGRFGQLHRGTTVISGDNRRRAVGHALVW
jgi:hypothetical protein